MLKSTTNGSFLEFQASIQDAPFGQASRSKISARDSAPFVIQDLFCGDGDDGSGDDDDDDGLDAAFNTSLSPVTSVPAANFALGFPGADAHVGTTSFGVYSDSTGAAVVGNTVIGDTVVAFDGRGEANVFSATTGHTLNATVDTTNQTITITEVPTSGG